MFEDGAEIWKIVIPQILPPELLKWYHPVLLGHCGQQRLCNIVKASFHSIKLQKYSIVTVKQCPQQCQLNKQSNKNYGHLPLQTARVFPWEAVAVDLIVPWKIQVNSIESEFRALTCINPVSNITEAVQFKTKQVKM